MRGSTFTLGPSRFDRRNAEKISFFYFSLPFLSLYLFDSSLSFSCFLSLLFFFPFLFFSFFLIHPHSLLFFVPSLSLFISFHFLFSHFFFSYFFLFSPPSSFSYQYGSSGGNFPPLFSLATGHHHVFLPYFLYFFLFIPSCNTWLNVSHLFQVYHMAHPMCHFPSVPCGITWSCHVSPDT